MRLKSLEIFGFKSFANKTIFSFPANVTAIVGPNGSGKSNVVDAIRWVLGERDLKGLRIGRSDEIIFGGTPNKARMSLAQVSITIDNNDGELPVDFKEIAITRKIDRDGESEYLINQSGVRLKDIVELLAKAKIGHQGMTIVNQGSADAILKVSPKERRAMIEESLGLREYQLKKEESKRRLISTEENLEKTRALLEELKPHLRSLRRQVGRWEKREELVNGVQTFEQLFFGGKFKDIYDEKIKIEEKGSVGRGALAQEERVLEVLEKEFDGLEKKRPDFSQEFKKLREESDKIEQERGLILRELGQIEGRIEGLKRITPSSGQRLNFKEVETTLRMTKEVLVKIVVSGDLDQIRHELKELIGKIDAVFKVENQSEEINEEVRSLLGEKESLLNKIKELEGDIKKINETSDDLRRKDEQTGSDSHGLILKIQKQRSRISALSQDLNDVLLMEEKIKLREADLSMKLKEAGLNIGEFSPDRVKNINIEEELHRADFVGNLEDLEMKIFRLRHELSAIGEVDEILLKEAKETEERYQFLSRESEDLEKAKIDLEKIIDELTEKIDTEFSEHLKVINEEFNKFFRLMFGGGKAKLLLVKPVKKKKIEEVLAPVAAETENSSENKKEIVEVEEEKESEVESGIDFYLDLPKKKIKSFDVLSGGERSLVATSILFAIVAAMHPPFIVLDEVDAALDEVNAQRFAKMLGELVGRTQFIVITHNRATMEVAKVLYGISMAEEGISKAISIKLEEVPE